MSALPAGTPVAVVGFGNQGEAHAGNLRAAGAAVTVGARAGGRAAARAHAEGFPIAPIDAAARDAAYVAVLLPDEVVPALWQDLAAPAPAGATFVFAHGFNLLYADLAVPEGADVVLVSPTGPGTALAAARKRGATLPAYVAVHCDASGEARRRAEAYAGAIACGPLLATTVREETEVDLFGEQAVLCGGLNAMVLAAFETLTARGYTPEVAYLECVHQVKYLADLLHARGPAGFREAISGTARFGDVTRGPRVVGKASREAMDVLLDEIRDGRFAREWMAEVAAGRPTLEAAAARAAKHPIEAARRNALAGLASRAAEDGSDRGDDG